MMRIGAVLRRSSMDAVDAWYERAGCALHEEGHKPHDPEVARHLLRELGQDPSVVEEALADQTTNDIVRFDHERVLAAGGFGVPTLFFGDRARNPANDQALFGPVLIDPPTGDAALRLWDAVTVLAQLPNVYELQRPKTKADERAIAKTFRPYLEARDWVSINRGQEIAVTEDGFDVVKGDATS